MYNRLLSVVSFSSGLKGPHESGMIVNSNWRLTFEESAKESILEVMCPSSLPLSMEVIIFNLSYSEDDGLFVTAHIMWKGGIKQVSCGRWYWQDNDVQSEVKICSVFYSPVIYVVTIMLKPFLNLIKSCRVILSHSFFRRTREELLKS